MNFLANFKYLKPKYEPNLRFKMKCLPYGDPWHEKIWRPGKETSMPGKEMYHATVHTASCHY